MSVTRGDFLRQLGKSIPGLVLGSGVALAAQKVLGKMAMASGAFEMGDRTPDQATSVETSNPPFEFIKNGPEGKKQIALTFDDGPTPGVTERILEELGQRNLRATFFMIGERIAAAPDLARRVVAEGHEIGNHTYTHRNLTTLAAAQVEEEIQKTQDIIENTVGNCAIWFRPPYGSLRQNQVPLVVRKKLEIVLWNVDPADWSQPGEAKIIESTLKQAKPGSILVCHDLYDQTANAAGTILEGLLERNLHPVTLSVLLEGRASFSEIK